MQVIKILSDGDYFGEVALLSDTRKRTATVRAEVETELAFLNREDYNNILGNRKNLKERNLRTKKNDETN
jgi:CRP-like cAMP-binding protein